MGECWVAGTGEKGARRVQEGGIPEVGVVGEWRGGAVEMEVALEGSPVAQKQVAPGVFGVGPLALLRMVLGMG